MINNEVYDGRGNLIGFRCGICDQIKTKMWGNTCNECRLKYPKQKQEESHELPKR